MAKLQLASSPAAELLATAPGNPSSFMGSERALPVFWFSTPGAAWCFFRHCLKQHPLINAGGPYTDDCPKIKGIIYLFILFFIIIILHFSVALLLIRISQTKV